MLGPLFHQLVPASLYGGADGVAGEVPASEDAPYCTRCEWDQTIVNIGGPEIRRYFRTADAAFFDRRSLRVLSDW